MNCPKCDNDMETVVCEEIEVDRCVNCRGIWFDMLEAEHLKRIEGSEAIDVGDPTLGKSLNEIDRIQCPKCNEPMLRMVDRTQPHIWYESCPLCYGLYFDAGEFADFKEETILDIFRDLKAGERK
jgi:Zn-finger nucleic acid-binding protein